MTTACLVSGVWERNDRRERARRAETRSKRAGAGGAAKFEHIAIQTEEADARTRLLRLDAVERAFRRGALDADAYRIARCLEADWLALTPGASGARLARDPHRAEAFVFLPAHRAAGAAPQIKRERAMDSLRQAHGAVARALGASAGARAWSFLWAFVIEGLSFDEIDRRRRIRKGAASAAISDALEAIDAARLSGFERRKWCMTAWASA